MPPHPRLTIPLAFTAVLLAACPESPRWEASLERVPGGLLTIWGTSSKDLWTAGADTGDGSGPWVLHFDGRTWERRQTGSSGDLWWIHGFASGPLFIGGERGTILRSDDGTTFTRVDAPTTTDTIFGVWGADPADLWAVGGGDTGRPLVWRSRDGGAFEAVSGFPSTGGGLFKVWGRTRDDVYFCGAEGAIVHWDGATFTKLTSGTSAALLTIHGNSSQLVAVGSAAGAGAIVQGTGATLSVDPLDPDPLSGVFVAADVAWAVGDNRSVLKRENGVWTEEKTNLGGTDTLHAVWVDPDSGDVWTVGGRIAAAPRLQGLVLHRGLPLGPHSVTVE